MGLKCSLLGHAYEPADVERERKEEGSEVVTVHREIERCVRCGEERVVSESTEVTAVVDEDEVDIEGGTGSAGSAGSAGGVDHPEVDADSPGVGTGAGDDIAARDPAEEDAEILTEREPDREPGAWPEEPEESWDPEELDETEEEPSAASAESGGGSADDEAGDHAGEIIDADADTTVGSGADDIVEAGPETGGADADAGGDPADGGPVEPDDETLSGITVPEGTIVCTECEFSVDADSSYRDGDPCPDCGAWLTSERNR